MLTIIDIFDIYSSPDPESHPKFRAQDHLIGTMCEDLAKKSQTLESTRQVLREVSDRIIVCAKNWKMKRIYGVKISKQERIDQQAEQVLLRSQWNDAHFECWCANEIFYEAASQQFPELSNKGRLVVREGNVIGWNDCPVLVSIAVAA